VLDAIKERGEVVTKVAYGDWKRAGEHSRALTQQAIRMVQRNMTPGGDKNGADINLALDALEMALTHQHINAYVIVGGDSDFISLVEKLKQYDKTVFVVGGRAFTSVILQKNCHEFIAYENVIAPQGGGRRTPEKGRPASQAPIKQAFQLVRRALKVLTDREVSPQLGLLKSTLLQLDSSFSERDYGVSSFRDFAEKLAESGFVRLNQQGRSVLVELKDGDHDSVADVEPAPGVPAPAPTPAEHVVPPAEPAALQDTSLGQPADAVRAIREMFETAPATMRWPMYVRNVKQYARSVDASFDERRYGFSGILDLLRACQREGVFRLERDRKGVLRVFPGVLIQRAPAAASEASPQDAEILSTPGHVDAEPVEVSESIIERHLPPSGVEPADAAVEAAARPVAPEAVVDEAPADQKPSRRHRAAGAPRKPVARAKKATVSRPRSRKKNPA
jgi:hypothetical protein